MTFITSEEVIKRKRKRLRDREITARDREADNNFNRDDSVRDNIRTSSDVISSSSSSSVSSSLSSSLFSIHLSFSSFSSFNRIFLVISLQARMSVYL